MKKLLALLVVALSSVTLHAQQGWDQENIDPDTGLRTGVLWWGGGIHTIAPGVNLSGVNLSGADLSGADLSLANLSGADLTGANLNGADVFLADLREANLFLADLSGADLRGTDLIGAYLTLADLSGADLSLADLSGANLIEAELSGADLNSANLSGVNLGSLITGVAKGNYEEIQALKPQVETNTTEIAELKTMMEAMSVQMQQLNARLNDQQASIEEKDQQIAELSQRPTLEQVQDARAGSLVFRADEETNTVTLEFEIQSSENLQDWVAQPEKVTATVPLDAEKKFVRIALAQD